MTLTYSKESYKQGLNETRKREANNEPTKTLSLSFSLSVTLTLTILTLSLTLSLSLTHSANTVCVMVVFPSFGSELQMRSFLESLDSEHSRSATSVKVKVPAVLIDAISFEESAATLTLAWSKNTRKVQVQGPLTMLDRAKEQLIKLLQTYRTYCESRKVLPPPKGGERAASMLRCPARSDYLVSLEKRSESNRKRATFVPQEPTFGATVQQVATGGTCLLDRWPECQTKFAECTIHEFGASEEILEDSK